MSAARQLWKPLRTHATQLGGQSSVELSGYLCQTCADAGEHVHSVCPSALEWALVSHLCPGGVGKLGWNQIVVSGLAGWATLVARDQQGSPPRQPAPRRTLVRGSTWAIWTRSASSSGGGWPDRHGPGGPANDAGPAVEPEPLGPDGPEADDRDRGANAPDDEPESTVEPELSGANAPEAALGG
jgi:hypothetical protein